ncbi:nucleic-acid-binding protein from transposon X-element [Trichonephila clavipes]|nr:nucleic-acid-binding protein from transposon X-element [Trichonephila clavipes]
MGAVQCSGNDITETCDWTSSRAVPRPNGDPSGGLEVFGEIIRGFDPIHLVHPRIQDKSLLYPSAEDHERIKNLLVIKKAEHYVLEHPSVIKAVIIGLLTTTDVSDVESELKEKGLAVEKIAQLRRFATKAPLPLITVELKRSDGTIKIYNIKNLNCLTVSVVRRKPGVTQCFNCNYFNLITKNCRMAPRCLKCGQNHRTQSCPNIERLKTLHCINCNTDEHMATSRQCPKFPKHEPKKGENSTTKTPINHRPVTPVVSFASVCRNKTVNQMTPREEVPKTSNQKPIKKEKTPDNAETNFKFEKFATYINEIQNITSKFPEIFRALEYISKADNDIDKIESTVPPSGGRKGKQKREPQNRIRSGHPIGFRPR